MAQNAVDKALLPPMRLEADDLTPDATAALKATRERLAEEFQAGLAKRQLGGLAQIAQQLADAEMSLGLLDEALSSYRKASQMLSQNGGEPAVLAATLYAVAEIERSKGRYGEAETSYLEAEKAFMRSEDNGARASCMFCAGEMRAKTNRIGDALASYEGALGLFRGCNDRPGQAHALFRSAEATARIDREAGKRQYRDAREIFDALAPPAEGESAKPVANEHLPDRSKDLRTVDPRLMAKVCAAQVVETDFEAVTDDGRPRVRRKPPNRTPLLAAAAVAALAVVGVFFFGSDPEPSRAEPSAARVAEPAVSRALTRAGSLRREADKSLDDGDSERARGLFDQSLEIYRRARDAGGQGAVLFALARIEGDAGNELNARQLYEESWRSYQQAGNLSGQAAAAVEITAIDESNENIEQLETTYARQAEACEASADRECQTYALEKLVDHRVQAGEMQEAYELLVRLLPVHETANDTLGTARTLEQMGALEMQTEIRRSTRARLERAHMLYRENNQVLGQARTLMALGDLDMNNEKPWQARATYRQVVGMLADQSEPRTHRDALVKLATAEGSLGQKNRADELFRQALETCGSGDGPECRSEILGRLEALEKQS